MPAKHGEDIIVGQIRQLKDQARFKRSAAEAETPLAAMRCGRVYFVSGIDTGVGKTAATGLMARWLAARGHDVTTVKLVQTGNTGFSEDIAEHRRICGGIHLPEDDEGLTAPQIFRFPSSPLLAASLEGKSVDLDAIRRAVAKCAGRREIVLAEGAGGLAVPLTEDVLAIDFAASCGWPLVLVTCGRLGSINHTLLSLEAAKARGMSVAGIVWNWCEGTDPAIDADARAATRRHLAKSGFPPCIVEIPRLDPSGPYPDIDFSEIFA